MDMRERIRAMAMYVASREGVSSDEGVIEAVEGLIGWSLSPVEKRVAVTAYTKRRNELLAYQLDKLEAGEVGG